MRVISTGSTSINRNIVECKEGVPVSSVRYPVVLIETLWNVKKECDVLWIDTVPVLIETLWNVKWITLIGKRDRPTVLIETLWNVKFPQL